MVKVEVAAIVPLVVIVAGLNEQAEYAGSPLQENATAAANPPDELTEIMLVAELPPVTVPLPALNATLKSAGAVTITLIALEVDPAKLLSPPYTAVIVCPPNASALAV
jgi:hypothetical protein